MQSPDRFGVQWQFQLGKKLPVRMDAGNPIPIYLEHLFYLGFLTLLLQGPFDFACILIFKYGIILTGQLDISKVTFGEIQFLRVRF
jgi:hypothetical protein